MLHEWRALRAKARDSELGSRVSPDNHVARIYTHYSASSSRRAVSSARISCEFGNFGRWVTAYDGMAKRAKARNRAPNSRLTERASDRTVALVMAAEAGESPARSRHCDRRASSTVHPGARPRHDPEHTRWDAYPKER